MSTITVSIEATPNPEAMKFVTNQPIANENRSFADANETQSSPLAKKLFGFPWAKGVMIGPNFVTIIKQDWVDWNVLAEPLAQLIQEHFERGGVALDAAVETVTDDSPLAQKIRSIFDTEIRPAVAMDGGDIVFRKFEDGKVFVNMHGACAGCPSSMITLKDGIEARLKEMVPEVTEVVAL